MSSRICRQCGAKCCKYFCFQIDTPEDYEQFEDIRWYLCHEGVTVHVDEGDWYMSVMNPCTRLGADDRCTIYEDRPLICRKYDTDNCDRTAGDYGYQAEFTSPEQLDAYARQALGEKTYLRQKRRLRAKYGPDDAPAIRAKPAKGAKGRAAGGKSAGAGGARGGKAAKGKGRTGKSPEGKGKRSGGSRRAAG